MAHFFVGGGSARLGRAGGGGLLLQDVSSGASQLNGVSAQHRKRPCVSLLYYIQEVCCVDLRPTAPTAAAASASSRPCHRSFCLMALDAPHARSFPNMYL